MRVFVLSTGRCGSVTFARSCGHLANFTAGHESRARLAGPGRLAYPDGHIEVDNRLSWFLGGLAAAFDDEATFYVHLRREPEAVARSFLGRWDRRGSIIGAFSRSIVQRRTDWPDAKRLGLCRFYVATVTANIEAFLVGRPSMTIWLEQAAETFPTFLDRIGAEGDLAAAVAEWSTVHNAG